MNNSGAVHLTSPNCSAFASDHREFNWNKHKLVWLDIKHFGFMEIRSNNLLLVAVWIQTTKKGTQTHRMLVSYTQIDTKKLIQSMWLQDCLKTMYFYHRQEGRQQSKKRWRSVWSVCATLEPVSDDVSTTTSKCVKSWHHVMFRPTRQWEVSEQKTPCLGALLEGSHTHYRNNSHAFVSKSAFFWLKGSGSSKWRLTLSLPMGSGWAVYMFLLPSYPGCRSPKICILKCLTMVSTTSLHTTSTTRTLLSERDLKLNHQDRPHLRAVTSCFCRQTSPVDPPGSFLWLDLDVIVVDVDLGDLHLEVIGQQANRLPHRAQAGPARWLEKGGRGRRAYRKEKNEMK